MYIDKPRGRLVGSARRSCAATLIRRGDRLNDATVFDTDVAAEPWITGSIDSSGVHYDGVVIGGSFATRRRLPEIVTEVMERMIVKVFILDYDATRRAGELTGACRDRTLDVSAQVGESLTFRASHYAGGSLRSSRIRHERY